MTDIKGSCLCGSITFSVKGPIRGVGSCHCSKCRKVSGTTGNAQFIVRTENFQWTQGEGNVSTFRMADGWGLTRCKTCGSPVPESYDGGERMWVQAGLMDEPLETDFKQHIFCDSRADWDKESPDAQHHAQYPE